MTTVQGWSTSPDYQYENNASTNASPLPFPLLPGPALLHGGVGAHAGSGNSGPGLRPGMVCQACGHGTGSSTSIGGRGEAGAVAAESRCMHADLVRSVVLGENFALSGSYDMTIKVCGGVV